MHTVHRWLPNLVWYTRHPSSTPSLHRVYHHHNVVLCCCQVNHHVHHAQLVRRAPILLYHLYSVLQVHTPHLVVVSVSHAHKDHIQLLVNNDTPTIDPCVCAVANSCVTHDIDAGTCTNCPAGSQCSDPTVSPVQCLAGTYAIAGSKSCTSCGPTGYQTSAGNHHP